MCFYVSVMSKDFKGETRGSQCDNGDSGKLEMKYQKCVEDGNRVLLNVNQ